MTGSTTRGNNWIVNNLGGRLTGCRPIVVGDDALVAIGSIIHGVSTKTGELMNSFEGHDAAVTSISILPASSSSHNKQDASSSSSTSVQIVSSSSDGNLIVWTYPPIDSVLAPAPTVINVGNAIFDVLPVSPTEVFLVLDQQALSSQSPSTADSTEITTKTIEKVEKADAKQKNKKRQHEEPSSEETRECKLVSFDLITKKILRRVCDMRDAPNCIAKLWLPLSANSTVDQKQLVVVAVSKSKVTLWSTLSNSILSRKPCSLVTGSITCIAASNDSEFFVTGHSHGELIVWRNLIALLSENQQQQQVVCTRLHWHSQSISSIALSVDGLQLYSGGQEGALVMWKTATGAQTFLPRLGSAVAHIVDGNHHGVLVTTHDNCVRIVNPINVKVLWQLKKYYTPLNQFQSDLTYRHADSKFQFQLTSEPRSGLIAMNGYPGELQMSDVSSSRSSSLLSLPSSSSSSSSSSSAMFVASVVGNAIYRQSYEITDFTRVSSREAHNTMFAPTVSFFKFHQTTVPLKSTTATTTENVLCTVDVRRGEGTSAEASLKFWWWNNSNGGYKLTAQVDRPHGSSGNNSKLTCLDVANDNSGGKHVLCVTGSADGTVKVWAGEFLFEENNQHIKSNNNSNNSSIGAIGMSWTCSYSFTHRSSPCGSVCFSQDSSLLCVAHGSLLSIWNPASLQLAASLVDPDSRQPVSALYTIAHNQPHHIKKDVNGMYLVVVSSSSLSVFDLLSLQLLWSETVAASAVIEASAVATHPQQAINTIVTTATTTTANTSHDENNVAKSAKKKPAKATSVTATTTTTTPTATSTGWIAISVMDKEAKTCVVKLFSVHNNETLLQYDILNTRTTATTTAAASVSSLLFSSSPAEGNGSLLVLTKAGELLRLTNNNNNNAVNDKAVDADFINADNGNMFAQVKTKKLSTIRVDAIIKPSLDIFPTTTTTTTGSASSARAELPLVSNRATSIAALYDSLLPLKRSRTNVDQSQNIDTNDKSKGVIEFADNVVVAAEAIAPVAVAVDLEWTRSLFETDMAPMQAFFASTLQPPQQQPQQSLAASKTSSSSSHVEAVSSSSQTPKKNKTQAKTLAPAVVAVVEQTPAKTTTAVKEVTTTTASKRTRAGSK